MADQLLLIGAGGFVGRGIAAAAARRGIATTGLVRSPSPALDGSGVEVMVGDARAAGLGLHPDDAEGLARRTTTIVMAAGRAKLSLSLVDAQREHVAAVQGAVDFARRCPHLERIVYLSSMVAVGQVSGPLRSDFVPVSLRVRNFYEWAKAEGERVVRTSGLPACIVRPGHVWNSTDDSLRTTVPVGVFETLPLLAAGWPLPVDALARYWIAPVDLVADITLAVATGAGTGRAVWAVDPASPRLGEVLDLLAFRHGLRARRVTGGRMGRLLADNVQPRWLGVDVDREAFAYGFVDWRLDLRCLDELTAGGALDLPTDRSYVTATIDHEVRRRCVLP